MGTSDDPPGDAASEPAGDRVRIYRRGATWYANYQVNKKQHRESLKTARKKEARRRAAAIDARLTAGDWRPAVKAATLAEASAAYLDYHRAEGKSEATLDKYGIILRLVAGLADARNVRDLSGIDLSFLDAYRRSRVDAGCGPKTVYTEAVIVRQLVNFALSRNMVAADPLRGLKLKKPRPAPQPCWTRDEVERIVAASPDGVRPALALLAETGMRFGELAWLTWDDVDLAANVLRVRPKDGWKPKSGDQRAVPLSPAARAAVGSLPRTARWLVAMPPTAAGPVAGRQWNQKALLAALKKVLRRLGLPGKLHTFRHSFISHALLRGTPVPMVRTWVGHVDARVIDLYTRVHDEASQGAIRRLAGAEPPPGAVPGGSEEGSRI